MPTAVGPNTKGEENLVFGYDLGDARNSYKGEPTTNLVEYSEQQNRADYYTEALPGWDTHEGSFIVDPINKIPGYTNRSIKMTCVNANVYKSHFGNTLTNGQTYTVSFWAKGNTAGTYGNLMLGEGMWGQGGGYISIEPPGGTALTTEFQRYKYTFTLSYPTGYYYFSTYLYIDGQVVWLTGFQFENKEHATQYLPCNGATTTRSATQGLIDLKGNSTIDLTNVSFDSNAQMTFDGSNDYASVAYSTALNTPTGATYEIMLYPQGAGEFLSRGKSDSGTDPDNPRFYVGSNGSLYFDWSLTGADTYVDTPASAATLNNWNHIVGVVSPGDQLRIYVNGSEVTYNTISRTVPATVPNTTDPLIIGGATWVPRYFTGKVGAVRLYSRALTASEIRSNFDLEYNGSSLS
jgi:hypothetical protein